MGLFSNYCGPGGKGIPRHVTDTLCKLHDESEEYKHIVWAYSHFNGADEDFLKALGDVIPENTEEKIAKWGAETWFNFKKRFFPDGMGGTPTMSRGKRKSDTTDEQYRRSGVQPPAKDRAMLQHGLYVDHNGDEIVNYTSSLRQSLENSPDSTQAIMADDAPKGIEGAESQLSKVHDVWTRFPNSQWAKLGWWYTNFVSDQAAGVTAQQTRDAFDQPIQTTATDLLTSGGGALTNVSGAHKFGASGIPGVNPSGHDFQKPLLMQFRMTSPYNIMKTYTAAGLTYNNVVGNSQPAWLEMFEGKYQFYHVSECDWRIDFNFGTPFVTGGNFTNQKDLGYYIFWKYTSNDTPPTSYNISNSNFANGGTADAPGRKIDGKVVLTGGSYTNYLTPDDYFRMKGFNSKHVSLSTTHPTHVTIGGKYKFGQCKMDIKQQDHSTLGGTALQTEGWIQTGSTYLFPEDLSVIIVQDNAMNALSGIYTPMGYRVNTEMLTEFRDLRSAFKFPTPSNSYINTGTQINTEASFFNKGAAYT